MKTLFVIVFLATVLRVQAEMNWDVYKKVTGFNQTLTLYCQLGKRCKEAAGWVKWVSNSNFETLIFSVKEKSFDEYSKYDGRLGENGFYLMIRNVCNKDFGLNYSCTYGIDISSKKILALSDAFIDSGEPNITKSLVAKTKDEYDHKTLVRDVVYPVVISIILVVVVSLSVCLYRVKKENNPLNSTVNDNTNAAKQNPMLDSSENSNELHQLLPDNLNVPPIERTVENTTVDNRVTDSLKLEDGSTAECISASSTVVDVQYKANQNALSGSSNTSPKQMYSMSSPTSCNPEGHAASFASTRELRHDDLQQATQKSEQRAVYHDTSLDCGTGNKKYSRENTEHATMEDFYRSEKESMEYRNKESPFVGISCQ